MGAIKLFSSLFFFSIFSNVLFFLCFELLIVHYLSSFLSVLLFFVPGLSFLFFLIFLLFLLYVLFLFFFLLFHFFFLCISSAILLLRFFLFLFLYPYDFQKGGHTSLYCPGIPRQNRIFPKLLWDLR